MKWYRLSAEQGYASAQYSLGLIYGIGKGVLQDYIRAHMWLNVCAMNGDERCIKIRDEIANEMTSNQIAEAQTMAKKWVVFIILCHQL